MWRLHFQLNTHNGSQMDKLVHRIVCPFEVIAPNQTLLLIVYNTSAGYFDLNSKYTLMKKRNFTQTM